jgi:hypothetical protein
MLGQESTDEPPDFPRRTGVELITERHEPVPLGGFDPNMKIATFNINGIKARGRER